MATEPIRGADLPQLTLPTHVYVFSTAPARTGMMDLAAFVAMVGAATVVEVKGYALKADMLADTSAPIGTIGRVLADGANNGTYLKTALPATWLLTDPEYVLVDAASADTSFLIQSGLGRRIMKADEDTLQLGGLIITGEPGGGIALTTPEGRVILSHSRFGTNFGGAVTIAPDGTAQYPGLVIPKDPLPQTGALQYAGEFALTPGMELPIFPTSLFETREAMQQAILDAGNDIRAPKRPWSARSVGGSLRIPYEAAGSEITLMVRRLADLEDEASASRYDLKYAKLYCHQVSLPWVWSFPAMMQGDSIGELGTPFEIDRYMRLSYGATPRWTGTYRTRANVEDTDDLHGPLSETRGGSRLDEHWGMNGVSPVADADWATYLAMPDRTGTPNKKQYAPLARAATGGDAASYVSGGMTLDIRRYLTATGQSDPAVWLLYLGINDYSQSLGTDTVRTRLLELLPKTIACIRRDLGNIPIILWTTMEARSSSGDIAYDEHVMMIQTITEIYNATKASDPTLYYVPAHMIQTENLGFDLNTGTTDAASGITTTTFADRIHPKRSNRIQHAQALAAMIAHVVPSWAAAEAIAGTYPTLDLDFGTGTYVVNKGKLPLSSVVTRTGSSKRYIDADGVPRAASTDVVVIDYADGVGGYIAEGSATNLLFPSAAPAHGSSQTPTVTAQAYTLSFLGTGAVTLSGAATGTVTVAAGQTFAAYTFTPAAGSLTVTYSGDVRWAQLEVGSERTSWIPTTTAAATRTADTAPLSAAAAALLPVTAGTVRWQGRRVAGVNHGVVGMTGTLSTNMVVSNNTSISARPPNSANQVSVNLGAASAEVGVCMSYSGAGTTVSANGVAAVTSATATPSGTVSSLRLSGYTSAAAGTRIKTRRLTIWPVAADAAGVQAKATLYPGM